MRSALPLAVLLFLLPAAATVDELGSADSLLLQVQQPEGRTTGTLEAAFWALAGDPTWTISVTVAGSDDCDVAVTPGTGTGQVAGRVTFTMRGTPCSARLVAEARDGGNVLQATSVAVVEAPVGTTGSVLAFWVPIGAVFALLLASIRWGNHFTSAAAGLGLVALLLPAAPIPLTAVILLAFIGIAAPGLWRTARAWHEGKGAGDAR